MSSDSARGKGRRNVSQTDYAGPRTIEKEFRGNSCWQYGGSPPPVYRLYGNFAGISTNRGGIDLENPGSEEEGPQRRRGHGGSERSGGRGSSRAASVRSMRLIISSTRPQPQRERKEEVREPQMDTVTPDRRTKVPAGTTEKKPSFQRGTHGDIPRVPAGTEELKRRPATTVSFVPDGTRARGDGPIPTAEVVGYFRPCPGGTSKGTAPRLPAAAPPTPRIRCVSICIDPWLNPSQTVSEPSPVPPRPVSARPSRALPGTLRGVHVPQARQVGVDRPQLLDREEHPPQVPREPLHPELPRLQVRP